MYPSIVLTPNRRMSEYWRHAFPGIVSWAVWMEQLREYLAAPVLSAYEEKILLEKIIREQDDALSYRKSSQLSALAEEAFHLCVEWHIPYESDFLYHEAYGAFQGWINAFQERCQREGWLNRLTAQQQLMTKIKNHEIPIPSKMMLLGFQELSPQQRRWCELFQSVGVECVHESPPVRKSIKSFKSYESFEQELRGVAEKIKILQQERPSITVGVVMIDLESKRSIVQRLFSEYFEPRAYNVSNPPALSTYPAIAAALLALDLLSDPIPLEKMSCLLRSVFFGGDEDFQKIRLERYLRNLGKREYHWKDLFQIADHLEGFQWWFDRDRFEWVRKTLNRKKTLEEWGQFFKDSLICFRWLSNTQAEGLQKTWEEVLTQYQEISVVTLVSFREALAHLKSLCLERRYLPQSPENAIQVLGVLEASGLLFDHLFILGMDDHSWPSKPTPNALLPLSLQKKANCPHASAEREQHVAKQWIEHLSGSAYHIDYSYARQSGGLRQRPSEILRDVIFNLAENKCLSQWEKLAEIRPESLSSEEYGPPLTVPQKLKRGSEILQWQAWCPFRAFAQGRLQAEPLPVAELGVPSRERGILVHQALYAFWRDLTGWDALHSLTVEALHQRIHSAIDWAFQKTQYPQAVVYLALERERLEGLLSEWISIEKEREPFEVVALEQVQVMSLGGFLFNLRVDRIDRVNHQDLLIDYKTGNVSVYDWFGERPNQIQMPLYGVAKIPHPEGLVYALLSKELGFRGVTKNQSSLPSVKRFDEIGDRLEKNCSWEEQLEQWREDLTVLAKEYQSGLATVSPLKGEETCQTCSLKTLCRVSLR